ncbi:PREDICTED: carbonic anhydrase 1-like [Nicrophorus vespilloides]|uniref:Carbonic anhydrase 1-like n=1 Tax=Nicrophorus vespilloides TaxID=110193 RepID=A0ABM1MBV3_NICVS|nr:PREDICTED: carbonic anhydrase 1-like [Nicrophorus vespilloides]
MASEIAIDDEYSIGNTSTTEIEDLPIHEGVQKVLDLVHNCTVYESPIDIHIPNTVKLELPPLTWHHLELPPKKVKLTNTGHTIILSAKWLQERPYLSGGPFLGNYVFSQLHFHWGANNMEGSEHTISGCQQPLEMHAVFFKSCYLTQESALKKKDGMCVIAFLFNLQDEPNPAIDILTDAIESIREPHTSYRLQSFPLTTYLKPFLDDYFMYLGSMEVFRSLLDANYEPLHRNFREVQPMFDRTVYHANPSGFLHRTMLILQKPVNTKNIQSPQQVNKYPRSSKEYVGATIFRTEVVVDPYKNDRTDAKESKTYTMNAKINVDPKILEKIKLAQNKQK